ncbi:MAG: DNA polymerase domain-containing protein [Methanobacteriota archaeon]
MRLAQDEDRFTFDYPNPELRTVRLEVKSRPSGSIASFADDLQSVRLGGRTFECRLPGDPEAERETLRAFHDELARVDPDVLTTQHGDRWDIPFLLRRIRTLGLVDCVRLGRDPDPAPDRPDQAAKSIHTYGRWLFKTHAYYLRGRWHIDLSKKTLDSEDDRKDLHGILYLARVSNRRAQDVNRNGAGFALQQMQIDLARDQGVALPWKRNLAEDWKDAATLCAVDRGGQIMVPRPGLFDHVAACDFSGYYPSLVVANNLSSDTINCACCRDEAQAHARAQGSDEGEGEGEGEGKGKGTGKVPVIPELGMHVCAKHYGHQAEILRRLAPHRRYVKAILRQAATGLPVDPDLVEKARAVKSEHKALGVVCFGYFRYRNARFGCAEVHQAIQCLGRAGMTKAREVANEDGFEVVHTLTDCIFLRKIGVTRNDALKLARRVMREVGVPMDVEGVYRWVVFLPSKTHSMSASARAGASAWGDGLVGVPNRYYGKFEDGSMKVRGIEVQRHSTPGFLYDVQQQMLDVFQRVDDAEGFLRSIPEALQKAKAGADALRRRDVDPEDLGLMMQTRMGSEEYLANTNTKAALMRLEESGVARHPGEYVKYIVARGSGPWASRTIPVELLGKASPWFGEPKPTYDVPLYLRLLARSVETLLSPFGYTEEGLYRWFSGASPSARQGTGTLDVSRGPPFLSVSRFAGRN